MWKIAVYLWDFNTCENISLYAVYFISAQWGMKVHSCIVTRNFIRLSAKRRFFKLSRETKSAEIMLEFFLKNYERRSRNFV